MASEESPESWLRPIPVSSQEQFVVALRRLRERSGLTFKQIERLTSAGGPLVLPASTLATALQRRTAPRPELVAALVRVCGGSPDIVDEWLALREILVHPLSERAAAMDSRVEESGTGLTTTEVLTLVQPRLSRRPRRRVIGGGAALLCLAALIGGISVVKATGGSDDDKGKEPGVADPAAAPSSSATVEDLPPAADYLVKINGLCLSEKNANDASGLIYLAPCERSFPQRRRLTPYQGGLWRVITEHPRFGPGCMGVVSGSTKAGAALSDDTCDRIQTDRYTLRRVPGGHLLLPEGHNLCVGTRGEPRSGAPLVQLPCDHKAPGQLFTVTPG